MNATALYYVFGIYDGGRDEVGNVLVSADSIRGMSMTDVKDEILDWIDWIEDPVYINLLDTIEIHGDHQIIQYLYPLYRPDATPFG